MFIVDDKDKICFSCLAEILLTNDRIRQKKKNQIFNVGNVMISHCDVHRRLIVFPSRCQSQSFDVKMYRMKM